MSFYSKSFISFSWPYCTVVSLKGESIQSFTTKYSLLSMTLAIDFCRCPSTYERKTLLFLIRKKFYQESIKRSPWGLS